MGIHREDLRLWPKKILDYKKKSAERLRLCPIPRFGCKTFELDRPAAASTRDPSAGVGLPSVGRRVTPSASESISGERRMTHLLAPRWMAALSAALMDAWHARVYGWLLHKDVLKSASAPLFQHVRLHFDRSYYLFILLFIYVFIHLRICMYVAICF